MEDQYKSVLVVNDTSEKVLTLYIYLYNDPLCWLSWSSKIIPVGDKYLYRSEDRFKFSLMATDAKKKKRTVLPVQKWKSDKLFVVSDHPLEVKQNNLTDFHHEKQICLRILNKDKKIANGINLYEVLKLNIDDVRKKKREEQNELIRKAYYQEIRRWHPDRCNIDGEDGQRAREIIAAYEILRDPEKRATYHNLIDYDSGWRGKLKAIFWPECYTKEQKENYVRRMKQFALSLGFVVGGIALSVVTAGLASPLFVVGGAVGGGALTCGGIQGVQRAMKRSSVKDGCSWKNYSKSVLIGAGAGAAIGGIGAGVAAGIAGIGAASLQAANVSVAQYVAMGASTGAAGGVVASLSNDADKILVDGEDVSLKEVVGHALLGAAVGGAAGIAGGVVTKAVEAGGAAAAAGNLKGDIAEQVFDRTGARRLGLAVARNVSKAVTESGTGTVVGSAGRFLEERLDDSMENRPLAAHVKNAAKDVVTNVIVDGGKSCVSSLASHLCTEMGQKKKKSFKSVSAKQSNDFNQDTGYDKKVKSQSPEEMDQPRRVRWDDFRCSEKYNPPVEKKLSKYNRSGSLLQYYDSPGNITSQNGRIRYIYKGFGESKVIVKYEVRGSAVTREVSGSGISVEIPANAQSISVRFQVKLHNFVWLDVEKYDHIKDNWFVPFTPHIFYYERPPIRTFILSGSKYDVKVILILNENNDELSDEI